MSRSLAITAGLLAVAAVVVDTALLDPSLVLLLRGSDQSSLAASVPDVEGGRFGAVETTKLIPLENYHSGERNAAFYLGRRDRARFRLEYFTTSSGQRQGEMAVLIDHRFVRPSFKPVGLVVERRGVYRFPVTPGRVTSLEMEVEVPGTAAAEIHVLVGSSIDGGRAQREGAPLSSAFLHHANLVKGRYRLPAVATWRTPDVRKSIPGQPTRDLLVLRRDRSVALANPGWQPQYVAICRPGQDPIYARISGAETQTLRDVLASADDPLVVVDDPFTRVEGRFGGFLARANQGFFDSRL